MLEQWKRKRDMIGGVEVVLESLSLSPVLRVYMRCDPWAGRNVSHSSNLYMFLVNGTESDSLKRSIYLIGCGAVVCRRKLLSTFKKKTAVVVFIWSKRTLVMCVCVCLFIVKNPFFRDLFRRTDSLLSPSSSPNSYYILPFWLTARDPLLFTFEVPASRWTNDLPCEKKWGGQQDSEGSVAVVLHVRSEK